MTEPFLTEARDYSKDNAMTDKPENPSAFACASRGAYQPGMNLRDYFAGQALVGLLSHSSGGDPMKDPEWAYKLANAMLAEREKGQ
jgi:hypothetical protein